MNHFTDQDCSRQPDQQLLDHKTIPKCGSNRLTVGDHTDKIDLRAIKKIFSGASR
jgi:hypothetical protein